MDRILGYQGAPYAPDYQPTLDEQLASMPTAPAPQVLGSVATPPEGPVVSYTPILGGPQYSAAPPTSSAADPGLLYTPAPNASLMSTAAPSAAPTAAAPPAVTPTAAPPPAAPPRGAQAPRAAGPAKLSEIGQIQTGLAKQQEQAASELYDIEARRVEAEGATAEAAQKAEQVTSALRIQAANDRAEEVRGREEDATIERETRRQAAEDTTKKLAAAQGELENTKLDIDAAYGGAAGRIFSGLAVALGSFGASMAGGPNYALQIVNDRVNRELDAQKNEIDKKKGKVTELGRLLQQNENLLGDATDARKLAQAQTELALVAKAESLTAGRNMGPRQQAVLDDMRTKAAATFRELQTNIENRAANTAMIGASERKAQRVAAANEAARQRKRGETLEDALALESGKKQIAAMFPDPEQQAKVTSRATTMAKEFDDKGLATGPGLFQNIMTRIGVDPITGATNPAAKVPGYTFGRPTPGASLFDSDVRELDRLKGETVESLAKATGGVVTGSDREGAVLRMKTAATLDEFRNAVKGVYSDYATKTRLFASADPQAFAILAKANPQLAALANYGATTQAAAAAGLRPVGR